MTRFASGRHSAFRAFITTGVLIGLVAAGTTVGSVEGFAQTTPGTTLAWSTLLPLLFGGVVTTDPSGNTYVSGGGNVSGFSFLKIAPDGKTVLWNKNFNFYAYSLATDASGNVYAYGSLYLPCGSNQTCIQTTRVYGNSQNTTDPNSVVFKLSPDGAVLFATLMYGLKTPRGQAPLYIDASGSIYITGGANCLMATTVSSLQASCPTASDDHAFVAKLDGGGSLVFSSFLGGAVPYYSGGSPQSNGYGITADATGVYVVGQTDAADFPVTAGVYQTTRSNPTYPNAGAFLTKLNSSGTSLVYSTYLPATLASGVAVDGNGNPYVTGLVWSACHVLATATYVACPFPTTSGVVEPNLVGAEVNMYSQAGYVLKLNATSSALMYGTFLRGLLNTTYRANLPSYPLIQVDKTGAAYVAGSTLRAAIVPSDTYAGVNAIQSRPSTPIGNDSDAFVAKLTPDASQYMFSTFFGGTPPDSVSGMTLAADGSVYIGGKNDFGSFPATQGVPPLPVQAGMAYIAHIVPSGSAVPILYGAAVQSGGAYPAALTFSNTAVGTTSAPLSVGLGNYGGTPLAVNKITASANFTQTNNCPATLAPGGHCDIAVTFAPTQRGTLNGTLTLTSDASGGAQAMPLAGTGQAPVVTLSASTLSFGTQAVGTTSAQQAVTVTNSGDIGLTFSSITATGDFTVVNSCGGTVARNAICTLQVSFAPTAAGQRNGTVTLTSNAANSPTTIALSGGVNPDFSVGTGSSTTATVAAGQTASYALSVTPQGGFTGTVTFTCSGAPTAATCSVSPSSMNVAGAGPAAVTVSVTTTARTAGASAVPRPSGWMGWTITLLFGAMVSAWFAAKRKKLLAAIPMSAKRGQTWGTVGTLGLLVVLAAMVACGGGGSSTPKPPVVTGTPAGTYTIVVSAASGSVTHTQNLTLNVN